MAIFTPLTREHIIALLDNYSIGTLVTYEGILQGVDNTNYNITTTQGRYILTLFESRIDPRDIPFFLNFMSHLKANGIMCPSPILPSPRPSPTRGEGVINKKSSPLRGEDLGEGGDAVLIIENKPACIFTFLDGANLSQKDITTNFCGELGTLLARIHLAGQCFTQTRANSMGFDAWASRIQKVGAKANDIAPHLEKLLRDELAFVKTHWPQDLPVGNIHADLFPDNVFQKDGHLYGVIDFYFSATDFLTYDLAITLNAWCFENGLINKDRCAALINAYEILRPLTAAEKNAFSIIARGAALRFISSRLYDFIFHDPKNQVVPKDPMEYIKILQYHMSSEVF